MPAQFHSSIRVSYCRVTYVLQSYMVTVVPVTDTVDLHSDSGSYRSTVVLHTDSRVPLLLKGFILGSCTDVTLQ